MIRYSRTIDVSRRVFDLVDEALEDAKENIDLTLHAYLQTFNNCREQGFVLNCFDSKSNSLTDLYIWVHEHRNTDQIVVRWQTEHPHNGMFNDETYSNRTEYFSYNEEHKAAKFIRDKILEFFKYSI